MLVDHFDLILVAHALICSRKPLPQPWRGGCGVTNPPVWTCPICGLPGRRSDEHIVTRWQESFFPLGAWTTINAVRQRRRNLVVTICEACNSRLNEHLEIPARELLTSMHAGQRVTVSAEQQQLIATYFMKHLLLMNLWARPVAERQLFVVPQFTDDVYRKFHATLMPPDGGRAWVGSIFDADPALERAVAEQIPEAASEPRSDAERKLMPLGSWIAAYRFGKLFVVFAGLTEQEAPAVSEGEQMVDRAVNAGALVQVWPVRDPQVEWPPPLPFDDTAHRRWRLWLAY